MDLEEDKAVIQTTTGDFLNLIAGNRPDEDAARASAHAEADRVCSLHGRHAVIVSSSCTGWEDNIGMFQQGCRTHRFLFACREGAELPGALQPAESYAAEPVPYNMAQERRIFRYHQDHLAADSEEVESGIRLNRTASLIGGASDHLSFHVCYGAQCEMSGYGWYGNGGAPSGVLPSGSGIWSGRAVGSYAASGGRVPFTGDATLFYDADNRKVDVTVVLDRAYAEGGPSSASASPKGNTLSYTLDMASDNSFSSSLMYVHFTGPGGAEAAGAGGTAGGWIVAFGARRDG